MATNNTAYDFELFEPRRREAREPVRKNNVIKLPQEKLQENRRPKISAWRLLPTALAFLIVAGMAGAYIHGQVQLSELSESLGAVNGQLSEDQSVYTQMRMKSDAQISLETVETYASDKLGMEKVNQNQVKTFRLSKGDKTQVLIPAGEQDWFAKAVAAVRRVLS